MGYRSDVTAIFYDPKGEMTYEEVLAAMKERFAEVFNHWPEGHWSPLDTRDETFEGVPVLFQADYVKWYKNRGADEFVDVTAFENMLTWFDQNPDDIAYEFGRIGEDTDDMEYKNSPRAMYRMQLERGWDIS